MFNRINHPIRVIGVDVESQVFVPGHLAQVSTIKRRTDKGLKSIPASWYSGVIPFVANPDGNATFSIVNISEEIIGTPIPGQSISFLIIYTELDEGSFDVVVKSLIEKPSIIVVFVNSRGKNPLINSMTEKKNIKTYDSLSDALAVSLKPKEVDTNVLMAEDVENGN